ncbi:MAG: aquaporin family protein [Alphaproteobacteria bacterium]|nr:aquaporin family protein [Alphaproteobacteria bacterium]
MPIVLAEGLGTGLLVATVVGSGIMAARLAGGNDAIALLGNTVATGAILYVLITIFGPVSGAQFNPAVTVSLLARGDVPLVKAAMLIVVQIVGGILGTWLAHAMFAEPILQISSKLRDGGPQVLSEFVATFGLVLTIFGTLRYKPGQVAPAVALYITAAYWFTASTSFANPAVTIARALSDTFSGIAPGSVLPFIAAQIAGAWVAQACARVLFQRGSN